MHKTAWALNKYFHLLYLEKLEVIIVSHNHQENILLVSIKKINKNIFKQQNEQQNITCYYNMLFK
jgi:uncharacterized protein YqfB (UPF0267 family)